MLFIGKVINTYMKNVQSYNKELRIATAQFMDVFNNIQIFRFNRDDTISKTITVPCKYGAKSIAMKSLMEGLKSSPTLPAMAFVRSSFTVDPERLFNIHREILLQQDGERDYTLNQPVGIDINFELNIFSMYPSDDDQILQNFMPFSMPNFYVAWKHPYTEETLKSQVIWSGDVSTEYPVDYDVTSKPRVISTTSFIYKTWIFPGTALGDGESGRSDRTDTIHTIISDYYATDDPLATYDILEDDV
jgi:hypothetical protein